jgi:hypothetical protein
MSVGSQGMQSDLSPTGQKTVIARYDVLKVLFLNFAAAVLWYASANIVWRHFVGGEPWPHSDTSAPGRSGSWAPIFLGLFVTFTVCAPFLFHLLYAMVFEGSAAIYVKDGWLVCHHPLMGRIRVEDISGTRIETQAVWTPRGVSMDSRRLVIQGRSGQTRKIRETWLACSLEDVAQGIDREITRETSGPRHATTSSAFSSGADPLAPTFGRRSPS